MSTPSGRSRCSRRSSGRGIAYAPFDLKHAAFSNIETPAAKVYFNQASPSAYVRGNTRAVPLALAYMRTLERLGRARAERRRRLRARVEQERTGDTAADDEHRHAVVDHVQRRHRTSRATTIRSAGPRSSSPIRAAAALAFTSSNRWRRSSRSSQPIRQSGCRTISSCCRSTCRTIPSRASSGWSFLVASCCTRCA